jgi:hypothetical protein
MTFSEIVRMAMSKLGKLITSAKNKIKKTIINIRDKHVKPVYPFDTYDTYDTDLLIRYDDMYKPDEALDKMYKTLLDIYYNSDKEAIRRFQEINNVDLSQELSDIQQDQLNEYLKEQQELRASKMSLHILDTTSWSKTFPQYENYKDYLETKSRTIGWTETSMEISTREYETALALGKQFKKWYTMDDNRVRKTHMNQNKLKIPIHQRFPNGLMYPSEPNGAPQEIINCRCFLTFS